MAHAIHASCIGCTACARQCPTQAIVGRPDAPHRIDPARCIDCGVCGWVCPVPETVSGPTGTFYEHLRRSERPHPRVRIDDCNGCGACVDICPFGSLRIVGERYVGWAELHAPDTCVGCGECIDRCSKGAIVRAWPGAVEKGVG